MSWLLQKMIPLGKTSIEVEEKSAEMLRSDFWAWCRSCGLFLVQPNSLCRLFVQLHHLAVPAHRVLGVVGSELLQGKGDTPFKKTVKYNTVKY